MLGGLMVHYIPKGFHTVTPFLCIEGAHKTIEFLKKAFDVQESNICGTTPDGKVMHAELKIGDSWIMIGEAQAPAHPATPSKLYLYVQDTDKVYKQALNAGGKSVQEPADQFYGDRNSAVKDPSGNEWWIATHIEDVSPEELEKRAKAAHAKKEPAAAR
jgi:uncharacterized glyoxalase superfamily protein PhnB